MCNVINICIIKKLYQIAGWSSAPSLQPVHHHYSSCIIYILSDVRAVQCTGQYTRCANIHETFSLVCLLSSWESCEVNDTETVKQCKHLRLTLRWTIASWLQAHGGCDDNRGSTDETEISLQSRYVLSNLLNGIHACQGGDKRWLDKTNWQSANRNNGRRITVIPLADFAGAPLPLVRAV